MKCLNIADAKDPDDQQGRSYREINNARTHMFNVGDLVELETGARVFVAMQTRDCDGTPLYCLTPIRGDYEQKNLNHNWIKGRLEESLELA